MKQSYFNFQVNLTWSKIIALVILGLATYLDRVTESDGSIFMFSLPFAVGMIVGKQGIDKIKEVRNTTKTD